MRCRAYANAKRLCLCVCVTISEHAPQINISTCMAQCHSHLRLGGVLLHPLPHSHYEGAGRQNLRGPAEAISDDGPRSEGAASGVRDNNHHDGAFPNRDCAGVQQEGSGVVGFVGRADALAVEVEALVKFARDCGKYTEIPKISLFRGQGKVGGARRRKPSKAVVLMFSLFSILFPTVD